MIHPTVTGSTIPPSEFAAAARSQVTPSTSTVSTSSTSSVRVKMSSFLKNLFKAPVDENGMSASAPKGSKPPASQHSGTYLIQKKI